jgi:hypothetical protein
LADETFWRGSSSNLAHNSGAGDNPPLLSYVLAKSPPPVKQTGETTSPDPSTLPASNAASIKEASPSQPVLHVSYPALTAEASPSQTALPASNMGPIGQASPTQAVVPAAYNAPITDTSPGPAGPPGSATAPTGPAASSQTTVSASYAAPAPPQPLPPITSQPLPMTGSAKSN